MNICDTSGGLGAVGAAGAISATSYEFQISAAGTGLVRKYS
jgi:hypothetical protein